MWCVSCDTLYLSRRAACLNAAKVLGIESLRDTLYLSRRAACLNAAKVLGIESLRETNLPAVESKR